MIVVNHGMYLRVRMRRVSRTRLVTFRSLLITIILNGRSFLGLMGLEVVRFRVVFCIYLSSGSDSERDKECNRLTKPSLNFEDIVFRRRSIPGREKFSLLGEVQREKLRLVQQYLVPSAMII
jgi:hypothetical protein